MDGVFYGYKYYSSNSVGYLVVVMRRSLVKGLAQVCPNSAKRCDLELRARDRRGVKKRDVPEGMATRLVPLEGIEVDSGAMR